MIGWYKKLRLRWAARILADHIVVLHSERGIIGCDVARNDLDTITFGIVEDIRVEMSESLKAAVSSVPR